MQLVRIYKIRLYLSSFGFGNTPEQLLSLVGSGRNAVVIANALDNFPDQREKFLLQQIDSLSKMGFSTKELDLRNYFVGKRETAELALQEILSKQDLIWVTGGNAFLLRRAMKQSEFDKIAVPLIKGNFLTYGGFSAGSIVVGPTLHGIEFLDKSDDITVGYNKETIWDGLGLVDFSIVPHYDSGHSEFSAALKTVDYFKSNDIEYKTLRDGEVFVVSNVEQVVEQIQVAPAPM